MSLTLCDCLKSTPNLRLKSTPKIRLKSTPNLCLKSTPKIVSKALQTFVSKALQTFVSRALPNLCLKSTPNLRLKTSQRFVSTALQYFISKSSSSKKRRKSNEVHVTASKVKKTTIASNTSAHEERKYRKEMELDDMYEELASHSDKNEQFLNSPWSFLHFLVKISLWEPKRKKFGTS